MSNDKGLGEQALNKLAQDGFSNQLDEVEELDVDIQTDPLKAVQGKVDSVLVKGTKVIQGDLRAEQMTMEIGSISIDAMSAVFGDIKLENSTDATAHLILKEQDVSRALNSELVRNKLKNLRVKSKGQPTIVDVKQVEVSLPGDGRIGVKAEVALQAAEETHEVIFTASPHLDQNRGTVFLKDIQYNHGKDVSPQIIEALCDEISGLLELQDFTWEGMSLRLTQLKIQQGQMALQAQSHVENLPSS